MQLEDDPLPRIFLIPGPKPVYQIQFRGPICTGAIGAVIQVQAEPVRLA
jgi:hypothetical protein